MRAHRPTHSKPTEYTEMTPSNRMRRLLWGVFGALTLFWPSGSQAATLFWLPSPEAGGEQGEGLKADVQATLGECTLQALTMPLGSPLVAGLYLVPGAQADALLKQGLQPLAVLEQTPMVLPPPGWVLLEKSGGSSSGARRLAARALSSDERSQVQAQVFQPVQLSWEEVRVVEVGKGLDVLLALRNGQVELGVIREAELEQARKVAPPLVQALMVVNRSPSVTVQVLAVPEPSPMLEKYRGLVQKLLARPVPTGLRWVSRLPLPATASQPPVAEGKTP